VDRVTGRMPHPYDRFLYKLTNQLHVTEKELNKFSGLLKINPSWQVDSSTITHNYKDITVHSLMRATYTPPGLPTGLVHDNIEAMRYNASQKIHLNVSRVWSTSMLTQSARLIKAYEMALRKYLADYAKTVYENLKWKKTERGKELKPPKIATEYLGLLGILETHDLHINKDFHPLLSYNYAGVTNQQLPIFQRIISSLYHLAMYDVMKLKRSVGAPLRHSGFWTSPQFRNTVGWLRKQHKSIHFDMKKKLPLKGYDKFLVKLAKKYPQRGEFVGMALKKKYLPKPFRSFSLQTINKYAQKPR